MSRQEGEKSSGKKRAGGFFFELREDGTAKGAAVGINGLVGYVAYESEKDLFEWERRVDKFDVRIICPRHLFHFTWRIECGRGGSRSGCEGFVIIYRAINV